MSVKRRPLIVVALASIALSASCEGGSENSPGTFDDCPVWSPDGRSVAFVRQVPEPGSSVKQPSEVSRIYVASPDQFRLNKAAVLPGGAEIVGWTLDGRIVVRTPTGTRRPVTLMDPRSGHRSPARRGEVIVRNGERYVLAVSGKLVRVWRRRPPASLARIQPVWSPDHRRIAFTAIQVGPDSQYQIYVTRADGTGRRQLTNNEENVTLASPSWSPDGTRLVYEGAGLRTVSLEGASERLTDWTGGHDWCADWSPAGEWIAFLRIWPGGILLAGESIVMVVHPDGSGLRRLAG